MLAPTTLGAAAGMGGGVFMNPALDVPGDYPTKIIAALSSAAVLTMSIVSVGLHLKAKNGLAPKLPSVWRQEPWRAENVGNRLLVRLAGN